MSRTPLTPAENEGRRRARRTGPAAQPSSGPPISAAIFAACLLHANAAAALSPLERIEPRLARAIEENRVFLTCTAVDATAFESAQRHWKRMVERARGLLVTNRASDEELEEFDRRTSVDALMRPDQPLAEAIALCRRHSGWFGRYGSHDFITKIDETPPPDRR